MSINAELHAATIRTDDGVSYNYLVQCTGDNQYSLYLHEVTSPHRCYQARVTSENFTSTSSDLGGRTSSAEDLLFLREMDITWNVEPDSICLSAMKSLEGGIKHRIVKIQLEICGDSSAADMLTLTASALSDLKLDCQQLQQRSQTLENECEELRQTASDAVTARAEIERHILAKCAALLNEKKDRIRTLQELLDEKQEHDLHHCKDVPGASTTSGIFGPSSAAPAATNPSSKSETKRPPSKANEKQTGKTKPHAASKLASSPAHGLSEDEHMHDEDVTDDEYNQETDPEEQYLEEGADDEAYEMDTQVESAVAPLVEETTSARGATPLERQMSQETDDSLELHSGGLDESISLVAKRAPPLPERPPEVGSKKRRHIADSDDLDDLI